ncbi:MAG: MoaD/ThiS family protein [Dehalococcoidia bacterium]
MAISVSVKLFGDLRKYGGHRPPDLLPVSLPMGATIAELCLQMGVRAGDEVIAGVNGQQAQSDTELHDGDDVLLVSPMEGG